MLDGASPVADYVKYAKERGLSICSCTDHGWLSGAYDLITKSTKAGIKPVPGCEFYLSPHPEHVSDQITQERDYFHLTVWARSQAGYRNLVSLASASWDEGKPVTRWGKSKPRITWKDLQDYGEELIVGSGCIEGPIGKCLLKGEVDEAVRNANRLKAIFGDRLFFEVFPAAVDRDYVKENSVRVIGENGVVYRFLQTDILQTDKGEMTAAEATVARPNEIFAVTPFRVQDGPFDDGQLINLESRVATDIDIELDDEIHPPILPINESST
jgi:DNA polymerase III alpha subunit